MAGLGLAFDPARSSLTGGTIPPPRRRPAYTVFGQAGEPYEVEHIDPGIDPLSLLGNRFSWARGVAGLVPRFVSPWANPPAPRPPPPTPELPPWNQPTGQITGRERSSARSMAAADTIEDILEQLGAADISRYSTGSHNRTRYLQFSNPHGPAGPQATVRVPSDTHPATRRNVNTANFFDTAGGRNAATRNAGGGRYQEWDNLIDALRWRLSSDPRGGNWLVGPDRAPRNPREAPFAGPRRIFPEGDPPTPPGPHPDQLRLLGAGAGAFGLPQFMEEGGSEAWRRLVPGLRASVGI